MNIETPLYNIGDIVELNYDNYNNVKCIVTGITDTKNLPGYKIRNSSIGRYNFTIKSLDNTHLYINYYCILFLKPSYVIQKPQSLYE